MIRPHPPLLAVCAILAFYGWISLWPGGLQTVRLVANAAEPLAGGGIRFAGPGIVRAGQTPDWVAAAIDSQRLEIDLRVRSLAPDQDGPARILTLARGPRDANLMIGQDGDGLVLRLRTPETDPTGKHHGRPLLRVEHLFAGPAWVDLRVRIEPGRLNLTIDDAPPMTVGLPPDSLAHWPSSPGFALGNEVTFNRPWRGEIRRAVIRAGAGGPVDYGRFGRLERPPLLLIAEQFPKLVPFAELNLVDAVRNLLMYLPAGVLLGIWVESAPGRKVWLAVGAIAAFSATMEVLQLFVPGRYPSVDDLILNTIGGSLAIWAWLAFSRRSGWVRRHREASR